MKSHRDFELPKESHTQTLAGSHRFTNSFIHKTSAFPRPLLKMLDEGVHLTDQAQKYNLKTTALIRRMNRTLLQCIATDHCYFIIDKNILFWCLAYAPCTVND